MAEDGGTDDEGMAARSAALASAVDRVLAGWVLRSVEAIVVAWRGPSALTPAIRAAAEDAGRRARVEVGGALQRLLAVDVDRQRSTPLAVLRGAVRYPTAVLREAGVPPVVRDEFAERSFPDDLYGLTPATFADIDPTLHDVGIEWGAAKAHVHLSRRRRPGA